MFVTILYSPIEPFSNASRIADTIILYSRDKKKKKMSTMFSNTETDLYFFINFCHRNCTELISTFHTFLSNARYPFHLLFYKISRPFLRKTQNKKKKKRVKSRRGVLWMSLKWINWITVLERIAVIRALRAMR